MTFWERLKGIVGGVVREVVEVSSPASQAPPPRTVPLGHYGDQLLSDRERQEKWRRHAAEALQRELDRSPMPLRAYFPPSDPNRPTPGWLVRLHQSTAPEVVAMATTVTDPQPTPKPKSKPAPPPKRRPITSEPGRAKFWDRVIFKEASPR